MVWRHHDDVIGGTMVHGGPWESRLHRLSTRRFIPKGNAVPRVLIHRLSRIFRKHGSRLLTWSITITAMSVCECASLLKCAATGESSVLRCAMSWRWPFILRCKAWPVSPTYCWPHLLHIIKYIILEDLQEAVIVTLNCSPVVWLENSSVASSIGQVLHLVAPHGRLPGALFGVDVKFALTRISLKFFGRRKAISDGNGNAFRNRSEAWRMGRCCLVVSPKDGRTGWYVTTKGVRAVLTWSGFGHKHASLGVSSARWISNFNCC